MHLSCKEPEKIEKLAFDTNLTESTYDTKFEGNDLKKKIIYEIIKQN